MSPLGPFLVFTGLVAGGGETLATALFLRLGIFGMALAVLFGPGTSLRKRSPLDLPVLAFLPLALVSTAWAAYPWAAYQHALNVMSVSLFYFLCRNKGETSFMEADGTTTAWSATAAAGALSGAIALHQWGVLRVPRPAALFVNPNYLADVLVFGLVASAGLAFPAQGAVSSRRRAILLAGAAVTAAAMLAIRSRSVLAMAAAIGLFLIAVRRGPRLKMALLAAGALIAISISLSPRFSTAGDPFAWSRLAMWKAACTTAFHHPFGVGLGSYPFFWLLYREPLSGAPFRYGRTADSAHSLLFGTLAELGIPGLFLLAAAATIVGVLIAREARRPDRFLPICCIPIAAAVHSLFDVGQTLPGIALPVAACAAALANRNGKELIPWGIPRVGRAALTALIVPAVVYGATSTAAILLANRGPRLVREGRFAEARAAYARASRLDPVCAAYPDALASMDYREYLRTGEASFLVSAINLEQEAIPLCPSSAAYLSQVGFLLGEGSGLRRENAGLHGFALKALQRSLTLDPHSTLALRRTALLLDRAGDRAGARRCLEQAIGFEPNDVQCILALAGLSERSDPVRAVSLYRRALATRESLASLPLEPSEREAIRFDEASVRRRIAELSGE